MSLPFTIRCIEGWCDVTDEVEAANAPWTLARPDGVGVFQFSIATYKNGPSPNPTPEYLLSLLRYFASSRELGELGDVALEDGDLRLAGASFRSGDDFLRVWYVTDGLSFAMVTYTSVWDKQHSELIDCEQMIRTLKFEYDKRVG